MRFNVKTIKDNLKTISSVVSDYVYIDCTNDDFALYLSSEREAIKIPLSVSSIKDDEKIIFVISKVDFVHLISFTTSNEIEIDSNYKYISNNGVVKGKFESNKDFADTLESIKVLFIHSDEYSDFITVTPSILEKINRGAIFVSPNDIKSSYRNLNIKDKKIFSSSDFRIYINSIDEIENDGIISFDVLKSIQNLGVGAVLKKNNDSILVCDSENTIYEYISIEMDVPYIPVLEEKFQTKVQGLYETTKVSLSCGELKDKLNYISFYSQKNPSSLGFLKIKDGKATVSSNEENVIDLEISSYEEMEVCEDEYRLPFNVTSMLNILSKLGKDNIDIYASKNPSVKLFIIKFGENEEVILSKLNA